MSESRTRKATRNIKSSIVQMIINLLINFLGRVIFVKILDASYLGINGLFANILNILSMADLGMATAMMYHLYTPIAEDDKEKIKSLVAYFKKIYIIIAASVFTIGISLLPFLKYIIKLEEDIPFIHAYYVLALLNVVISYLFVYRTTLVAADQKNYLLNRYINIFKILTFVSQTIVLFLFENYFLYLFVALLLSFICNLCQNRIALKLYPFLKDREDRLDKEEKRDIFRDIKSLFIYRVAGVLQTNTDSVLISVFSGTVYVGYYSNYVLISNQVVHVLSLIFNNLKASVGNVIADANSTLNKKWFLYKTFELFNFWIVAFCSIALLVLSNDFIEIFFGKEYVLELTVVIAVVLNFYTSNIRQNIWVFRETTGIFEQTRHITVVTTILNVFGSVVFGYFWGIAGVLYATIISRMLYAWWREPQILFKEVFQKNAREYYATYISRMILVGMVCWFTYCLANISLFTNVYIAFVYKLLICIIVPNISFLILYYRSEEFMYFYSKLIKNKL